MRVDARLPADCNLAALDCGCDMEAVLRSCGSKDKRRCGAVYSQAVSRVASFDLETGDV